MTTSVTVAAVVAVVVAVVAGVVVTNCNRERSDSIGNKQEQK